MGPTKGRQVVARSAETAILLALPILSHFVFPITTIVPRPYTYLGVAVMIIGLALAAWAAVTFRRAGTSFQLHGESSVIVASGPFGVSRNPMYLGALIWLVGLAVLLGSLAAFLFPILLLLVANFLIIPLEERSMERLFKEQYSEYKRRVRRWL